MAIKSLNLIGFNVVFLYQDIFKDLSVTDFKNALKIDSKEKVAFFEISNAGIGVISFEEKKQRISIEGNRITFVCSDIQNNELDGLRNLVEASEPLLKKYPLKAYGLNYDVVVKTDAAMEVKEIYSQNIQDILGTKYKASNFGFQMTLDDDKQQYNINFSYGSDADFTSIFHINSHKPAEAVPAMDNLFNEIKSEHKAAEDLIKQFIK